jgi:predicted DNA-binding transcriptional regulator AlpA
MSGATRFDDVDHDDYYVDEKWITKRIGLSHTAIWKWQKEGRFPKAIKFSTRMTRWLKSEVLAWEKARREASHA